MSMLVWTCFWFLVFGASQVHASHVQIEFANKLLRKLPQSIQLFLSLSFIFQTTI